MPPTNNGCSYNAFLPDSVATVAATGDGALRSLGFAVKDLIDVAGQITGGGNPDWLAAHMPAVRHAPTVSKLLNAGAQVIGKTITDELAFSLEGANRHYGTPRNPRNVRWLPGGSSSGSAVAVAAGLADFALGTDTGGSVRVPAAFCGIFGFRPTHGAVSLEGVLPFAPSYDTLGWFARDAQTLQEVGSVLLPPQNSQPITRICAATDLLSHVKSGVASDMECSSARIATHAPVDMLDEFSLQDVQEVYAIIQGYDIKRALGAHLSAIKPRFAADIAARFDSALCTEEDAYNAACKQRTALTHYMASICPPDTALILPCVSQRHLLRIASTEEIGHFYGVTLGLTAFAGHWGAPQVQMGGAASGEGVGVSLLGAPGRDRALLNLAVKLSTHLEEMQ
ncbi:amidase [Cohaesibacter celericrescens]|uniref:Amidase n=1 Tax=Cohaesibacter celericrescens TaxID=2067669 RepID=A0A2N5XV14_9HYPH|nr:amidase [Cohaesibacter celericrescens]PLW78334.1 amidase [Cohaesibacter celericrescens]